MAFGFIKKIGRKIGKLRIGKGLRKISRTRVFRGAVTLGAGLVGGPGAAAAANKGLKLLDRLPKKLNLKSKISKIRGGLRRTIKKELTSNRRPFITRLRGSGAAPDSRRQRVNLDGRIGKLATDKLISQSQDGGNKGVQAFANKRLQDAAVDDPPPKATATKTLGLIGLGLSLWSALK